MVEPGQPPQITIQLLQGNVPNQWRFTEPNTILIGRSPENDVCLKHPYVSRSHSAVFYTGSGWECCKLGSNGMFVGRQRVSHVVVTDGIVIELATRGPKIQLHLGSECNRQDESTEDVRVSFWLNELKSGRNTAANVLWEHYFEPVARLARQRIGEGFRRVADEEDVALSVFQSLFQGVSEGRFSELTDRNKLWKLLVIMTSRRAIDHVHHMRCEKRGGGAVRGDSAVLASDSSVGIGFDRFASDEPTPEFNALMAEETQRLLSSLDDDALRSIALAKLSCYTNEEIAEEFSLSVRTVERKLQAIRSRWSQLLESEAEDNRPTPRSSDS